jgi:NAD(P)H-dependent nitrite reductase small subunit
VTAVETTRPEDRPVDPTLELTTPDPRTVAPGRSNDADSAQQFAGGGTEGPAWIRICPVSSLELDRGVRALVAGEAVAVFATSFSGVHAIGDLDPFSGASVLSRGLIGATVVDDHPVPFVASPLRKQRFDLRDGRSLEDPDVSAGSWPARLRDGWLEIGPRVS